MAESALLLRAAQIDGALGEEEREVLTRILKGAFSLTDAECETLFQEAAEEAENASDLYGWTGLLNKELDDEAKRRLIGRLWEVVYADGVCDDFESNLLRRVAGLLYVPDRASADLRRAVLSAKERGSSK